jgi:TonB family protein
MGSAMPRAIVLLMVGGLVFTVLPKNAAAGAGAYRYTIDPYAVREKIKRDLPKINRCYESALRDEPDLEGKVSVRFAVVRAGYVRNVDVVQNTTGNASVERCVARIVSELRFPRRRTGKSVRFTFPFVFAPQD